jgi:hypothetical protein
MEKDTFYKEQTNSKNSKYRAREVSVRVTPNGVQRSEHHTPNRDYNK